MVDVFITKGNKVIFFWYEGKLIKKFFQRIFSKKKKKDGTKINFWVRVS